MSEEIKEALEDIKRHLEYAKATKLYSIRDKQIAILYDYFIELQDRIDKAIEYIKSNELDIVMVELLEILGDKENESS